MGGHFPFYCHLWGMMVKIFRSKILRYFHFRRLSFLCRCFHFRNRNGADMGMVRTLIWQPSEAIVPPHQIQHHFMETSMELNAGMGDAAVISTVIQICIWLLHTCADVIINEPLPVHPRQRATLRPGLGFTERPQASLVGRVHGDFDAGSNVLTCNLLNACRK